MKTSLNRFHIGALALTAGLAACGSPDGIDRAPSKGSGNDDLKQGETPTDDPGIDGVAIDHIVIPPKGYYDALFAEALLRVDQGLALDGTADPQVIWVNFEGASVAKGFGRGQSFILCTSLATVPAAGLSPADQSAILQLVQTYYDAAGAKLVLTAQKPAAGDFTTIHVGGAYADLGCRGSSVLGVAPFDDGNANRNDVGFAFTTGVSSARVIAETIAHEAGHSFGLEHVEERKDLMFASSSSAIEGFGVGRVTGSARVQDGPNELRQVLGKSDGAAAPIVVVPSAGGAGQSGVAIPGLPNLPINLATLPGLSQLANIATLLPGLQSAGGAVDISQLLPLAQALIPLGAAAIGLPGLDQVLTLVGLLSAAGSGQGGQLQLPLPINQNLLTTLLGQVSGKQSATTLTNLAALGGFADLTMALAAIQTLFGGQGGAIGLPPSAAIPDLATLLGLIGGGTATTPTALITNLLGSAQVVNGNFQGADKDALLSLLKLAYIQSYAQIP